MNDKINALYNELNEILLISLKPSAELEKIAEKQVFQEYPFSMLYKMRYTEQSKQHHPEGNVWIHTMMVTDQAAKERKQSKNPRIFMWSALLHDMGKPVATRLRKGRITAYGHDIEGSKLAKEFLLYFNEEENFIEAVSANVQYHMHPMFVKKNLPFADIDGMKCSTDLEELALLSYCDRTGRFGADKNKEKKAVEEFLKTVQ